MFAFRPAANLASILAVTMLTGCASGRIGPDFVAPDAPNVTGYTADALPAHTASANAAGGQSQTFEIGANVPGRWWELFGSSELNRLVEEALAANPNLASAQQTLIQAQENYAANQASLHDPSVGVPTLQANASSNSPFTVTTQGNLRVSYSVDICCGAARQRESSEASLMRQQVSLQASYVSLTASVVNNVINLALLQERHRATEDVLALQQQILDISQQRLDLGDIAPSDLAQQQASLISTQSSLVSLESQIAQQTNQLAIYLGKFPSQMQPVNIRLDNLTLPTNIPVSLPSQLVAQRPDIVEAAYSLHSATANVGVTIADMLPQISLSGAFTPAGLAWNIASSIAEAAINVGADIHRHAAVEAALEAAEYSYQSTVIAAFVDVANALQSITYDARSMALEVQSEQASRNSLDLAQQEYQLGTAAYSTVLSAQQSYRNAVTSLLSARASRLSDTVALYVALGGGWWNTQ